MKLIRKRRNEYAMLFAISIFVTVWLGVIFKLEALIAFGAFSTISLLMLLRQSRLLYDARLIWDNRILSVASALIFMSDRQIKKETEETIVSTFGILIGSQIYRWGLDGLHGTRLHAVQINKERMVLTFGDNDQTMQVKLLHGMTEKQELEDTVQRLFYETGVTADIIGW